MAFADRTREFWDRISPRERKLVLLAVIAVPITIALWLGLSIHDGLNNMEARNDKTRQALAALDDLIARGTPPPAPVDDTLATMGTEPLHLEAYVNNAAQKAGFTIKSTRPSPPRPSNGFVTTSVSVDLDSLSIDELKSFLQAVEDPSMKGVVAVTHLEVSKNRSKPDKVNAALVVSTYSKEKKEGEAGSGSAAAGSDQGAPPAAGSASGGR